MLINLRNALMSGKRLPYDAEVEYLESTGTQYIDTGFKANTATTRLEASIEFTNPTSVQGVFGSRNRDTGNVASCNAFVLATNIFRPDWAAGSGGSLYNITISPNTIYEISITRGSLTINGEVHTYGSSDSVDQEYNFLLFNFSNAGSVFSNGLKGRLRYAKIYSNGVLVRDYIPVRKGTVGYLYDRVSGKLFGNAGTGDFVLGQDVVPVEYIESHGTEYIDTGVIPDNTTGIEVVHSICLDNGTDNIVFGMRQDSGNTRYWSDVDWGVSDSLGWGFNTYSGNNERFMLTASDVGRIITNSLNFMNDRAGKIDGVTYDSSLRNKTLATMSRSIYLFGANNQGVVGIRGKFKVYSAKISKGQTLANEFLSVRVGTEGAMMDVLTRRIYRNAGTGAFSYGGDLPLETLAN